MRDTKPYPEMVLNLLLIYRCPKVNDAYYYRKTFGKKKRVLNALPIS